MAEGFKAGDLVRLKSGGPLMTVTSVSTGWGDEPLVYTTWFDEKGKRENGDFPPETLDLDGP